MNRNRKIVVIGAGSAEFGLDSLAGIIRTKGLFGCELVLVDIDETKLRVVEKLAKRLNLEWRADMNISATTDRTKALPRAGYVILSVAIDRETSWKNDHMLALRSGITHYAENGGPGAFAHTYRNLCLISPILKDIETLAPYAYLLTFTNPLTRICTAISKISSIQNVGICHGIGSGYWLLANIMRDELGIKLSPDPRFLWRDDRINEFEKFQDKAKEKYSIYAAGINHFTWILGVIDKSTGEDILSTVKEKINFLPSSVEPLSQKMFQIFGFIPVTGDTHITEYVPYTADAHEGTWNRFDIQLYDFEWSNNRRLKTIHLMNELGNGHGEINSLLNARSERAEIIIDSLMNNILIQEEAVNIPNHGFITNLPEGAIIEIPGKIDSSGINGVKVGNLPSAIAAVCQRQLCIADLNVEAFLTHDRKLVYQMFAIDPMIQDPDIAIKLADEYIERANGVFH